MPKPSLAPASAVSIKIVFDSVEERRPFITSRATLGLTRRVFTDRDLITEALRARPDLTLERLAHDGALLLARDIIRKPLKRTSKSGVNAPGAADKRILSALKRIITENVKRRRNGLEERVYTPSTLAVEAKTNPFTAQRWFEQNRHLIPKDGK